MDVFTTVHNPENWDLISHSDGEYFEVSSFSSESEENELVDIKGLALDSDSTDSNETFIADIKMFHFSDSV